MGCLKGWAADEPTLGGEAAGDRVDRGDLHGVGIAQVRQDRGQAPRKHGLASARRATHQEVVTARRRHFECITCFWLPDDVREVLTVL